jgi:flap endonuclease-1
MGVNISEIIPKKEIELEDLKGKTIALDAFNVLYQFLTTIRQHDGTPLMNSKKQITSHLSGLFYRNINLLQLGMKLIYVFDGEHSALKKSEIERRKRQKDLAKEKYQKATQERNIDEMRKYSQQTVSMTDEIIKDSKELLEAMGIAVIQADSEGEEEAANIVQNRQAWASASQDYDSLLFGTPNLIRNLTLSKKRKTSSGNYVETKIEQISLERTLTDLNINLEQLISLGILVGTDFNPGGVKGIGQKRALEIVQKFKIPYEIFKFIEKSERYELDFDWQEVFKEFNKPDKTNIKEINFPKLDPEKIKEILLRNDFSESRIDSGLEKLQKQKEAQKQKSIEEFF